MGTMLTLRPRHALACELPGGTTSVDASAQGRCGWARWSVGKVEER